MRPAIFLDRDDTLIEDMAYTADPRRVCLKPGAGDALRRMQAAGYALVVVTNQSGIARGRYTEDELARSHDRLNELLAAESVTLDAIYFSPYLNNPDAVIEKYRRDSDLRKPKPGMLLQAAREHSLDLTRSWMMGDAPRDAEAGRAAGCRTILIGDAAALRSDAVDHVVPNITAAADIVLANGPPQNSAEPSALLPGTATSKSHASPQMNDTMRELIEELHRWMRESRRRDVGPGHLIGAVAQTFAVAALAWGLVGMFDEDSRAHSFAVIRLLAAIVFQLIAMTYLTRR